MHIFSKYSSHASTVLSVLHIHLLVLLPHFVTRSAPIARIRELQQPCFQRHFLAKVWAQANNQIPTLCSNKFDDKTFSPKICSLQPIFLEICAQKPQKDTKKITLLKHLTTLKEICRLNTKQDNNQTGTVYSSFTTKILVSKFPL